MLASMAGFKLAWGLAQELEADRLGTAWCASGEDGRWEGRIVIGHKENGDSIFRYIYADTQKELTAKLRQNIDAIRAWI